MMPPHCVAGDAHAPAAAGRVRLWSVEEFGQSQAIWDDLLRRSDADPLFLSWQWQWRWWTHHAAALAATLRLVAVYADGRLIGIAPFYSRQVRVRRVLQSRRLELIGVAWREPAAAFSDYLDIVAEAGARSVVIAAIDEWLEREPFWEELLLCCTKRTGVAAELVRKGLARRTFVREVDPLSGWRIRLPRSFGDYLQTLSASARRKLFNQRRKLIDPEVGYATEGDVVETLQRLWRLSAPRWGGRVPPVHVQAFHHELATGLARTGELRLSWLNVDGRPLSILYCAERADTVYYLQSGFDPESGRGDSPGLLHLGYAIEAACKAEVRWFDLLAGRGRSRDYKRDLRTEEIPVVNYHVVRGSLRRALYGAYERFQGRRNASHTI